MIKFKEFYEKHMNTKSLVIILIIGVLLLALPMFSPTSKPKEENQANFCFDISKYETTLEKKLASMLSEINGVSDVSVMITFKDYGKYIYSLEEQSEKSDTSQKGTKKPVLKNSSGGGEDPILIKAELPKISGVLITAKGAGNSNIKNNIFAAAKAVLDVNASSISVLEK